MVAASMNEEEREKTGKRVIQDLREFLDAREK